MHVIDDRSGATMLAERCESSWPMPAFMDDGGRWVRRQFPGQRATAIPGGIALSYKVVECSREICLAALEATNGADGFITDCGRYGVLPGTEFARLAKAWQARRRRGTEAQSK